VTSRDLDLTEQEKINLELEEFLQQIKDIRDGPRTEAVLEGILLLN